MARGWISRGCACVATLVRNFASYGLRLPAAAVVSMLMAPRADEAYAAALIAVIGIGLDPILTATINYAVLPGLGVETLAGLTLVLAVCLVPLGVLLSNARQP